MTPICEMFFRHPADQQDERLNLMTLGFSSFLLISLKLLIELRLLTDCNPEYSIQLRSPLKIEGATLSGVEIQLKKYRTALRLRSA